MDQLVTKEGKKKKKTPKKWEGGWLVGFFCWFFFFPLIFFIDFRHHVIRKPGLFPFPFPTKGKHCVAVALPPVGRAPAVLRRRIKITGIFKAGCGIPVQAERAWSAAELHRPRNLLHMMQLQTYAWQPW